MDEHHGVKLSVSLSKGDGGKRWLQATFAPTQAKYHVYSKDLPREGVNFIGRPTLIELPTHSAISDVGSLTADQPVETLDGLEVYPDGPVTLTLPFTLSAGCRHDRSRGQGDLHGVHEEQLQSSSAGERDQAVTQLTVRRGEPGKTRNMELDFQDAPSKESYLAQRHPRRGSSNPDEMSLSFWRWMVKSDASPYHAAEHYDAPSAMDAGPGWTFMRMGMSSTFLDDGRALFIAGEHEDYYDPDFYIYNDVIVRYPDGKTRIFCYPEKVFRPTDFHTATLVDDEIYILGSLGYPQDRLDGGDVALRSRYNVPRDSGSGDCRSQSRLALSAPSGLRPSNPRDYGDGWGKSGTRGRSRRF